MLKRIRKLVEDLKAMGWVVGYKDRELNCWVIDVWNQPDRRVSVADAEALIKKELGSRIIEANVKSQGGPNGGVSLYVKIQPPWWWRLSNFCLDRI